MISLYWKRIEGRYESVCGEIKKIWFNQSNYYRGGNWNSFRESQCRKIHSIWNAWNSFCNALKAIAPLLAFFIVMSALAQHKEGHETNMKSIVILYLFGTLQQLSLGVILAMHFPITMTLGEGAK